MNPTEQAPHRDDQVAHLTETLKKATGHLAQANAPKIPHQADQAQEPHRATLNTLIDLSLRRHILENSNTSENIGLIAIGDMARLGLLTHFGITTAPPQENPTQAQKDEQQTRLLRRLSYLKDKALPWPTRTIRKLKGQPALPWDEGCTAIIRETRQFDHTPA